MPQIPTTEDEPQNSRPFLAPPPALARPRSGAQMGLDGNPDPLRLGAGGVDAAPNGMRPGPQPGKGPR
jgi:hypothetical protein